MLYEDLSKEGIRKDSEKKTYFLTRRSQGFRDSISLLPPIAPNVIKLSVTTIRLLYQKWYKGLFF